MPGRLFLMDLSAHQLHQPDQATEKAATDPVTTFPWLET